MFIIVFPTEIFFSLNGMILIMFNSSWSIYFSILIVAILQSTSYDTRYKILISKYSNNMSLRNRLNRLIENLRWSWDFRTFTLTPWVHHRPECILRVVEPTHISAHSLCVKFLHRKLRCDDIHIHIIHIMFIGCF